jgi:hypothetical protein
MLAKTFEIDQLQHPRFKQELALEEMWAGVADEIWKESGN